MAKTPSSLRSIGLWTTAANAAVPLLLMIIAFVSTVFFGPASTSILLGFLLTVALIVWTLNAYLLFLWLLRRERSPIRMTITSIGSVAVTVWSAIVLIDAFLFRPDPQSALILLFLPVAQWIGCVITLMADAVAAHIESDDKSRTRWMIMKARLLHIALGRRRRVCRMVAGLTSV